MLNNESIRANQAGLSNHLGGSGCCYFNYSYYYCGLVMPEDVKEKAGSDFVRNILITAIMLMMGVIGWAGNNVTSYMVVELKEIKTAVNENQKSIVSIGTKQADGRIEWDDKAQIAFKGIEKALANDARQDIKLNSHEHRLSALERLRSTTNN